MSLDVETKQKIAAVFSIAKNQPVQVINNKTIIHDGYDHEKVIKSLTTPVLMEHLGVDKRRKIDFDELFSEFLNTLENGQEDQQTDQQPDQTSGATDQTQGQGGNDADETSVS